jgi:hypothetical protein
MIHLDIEMDQLMVKQPVVSARGEVSEFVASLGRAAGDDQVTEDGLFSLVLAA